MLTIECENKLDVATNKSDKTLGNHKLASIFAKKLIEMKKIILSMLTLSTMAFISCGEKDAETKEVVSETENVEVAAISGTYNVSEASVVTWNARHYKDTEHAHTGTVAINAGSIVVENEVIVGGEFEFNMASILEGGEPNDYTLMLQGHLMDTSFFFVADFATSTFTLNSVEGDVATGSLEVVGVSKEISFPVTTTVTEEAVTVSAEFDLDMLQFELPMLVGADALPEEEKMETPNPTITFQLDLSASKAAQ